MPKAGTLIPFPLLQRATKRLQLLTQRGLDSELKGVDLARDFSKRLAKTPYELFLWKGLENELDQSFELLRSLSRRRANRGRRSFPSCERPANRSVGTDGRYRDPPNLVMRELELYVTTRPGVNP